MQRQRKKLHGLPHGEIQSQQEKCIVHRIVQDPGSILCNGLLSFGTEVILNKEKSFMMKETTASDISHYSIELPTKNW